jgi:short-subunit dehydrogenase
MVHTIAILTGASRGIGAALARALAQPDTHLITLARRVDIELQAHANAQGTHLEQLQVDLSDPIAAAQAAQQVCTRLPRDATRYLLINNSGTVQPVATAAALVDSTSITAAFNLNVSAVMLLTAHFLAAVRTVAADRRILNISSGAVRRPRAGWSVYGATKAALDMYTRVVKEEQGPNGVRIVALAPGMVDTDMQAVIRRSDATHFPSLSQFRDLYANCMHSPTDAAVRILAYLNRADFGATEIDDLRHYE